MIVRLSLSEMLLAVQIAGQQQVQNLKQGRQARYGAPKDFGSAVGICLTGILGEMATAKALDKFWSGNVGQHGTTDVGGQHGVEVRSRTEIGRNLILHPRDSDDKKYVVAVTQNAPDIHLVGWCYGRDGKKQEFWQEFTGRPCFFVPDEALQPIEKILER